MFIINSANIDRIDVAAVLKRYLATKGLLPSASINSPLDQQLAKADIAAVIEILDDYSGIDVLEQPQAKILLTLHRVCASTTINETIKQDFIAYLEYKGWLSISAQEVRVLSLIPLPNSRPLSNNPALQAQFNRTESYRLLSAWSKCARLNLKKLTAWASDQSNERGKIAYRALAARSYYSARACLNLIMVNFAASEDSNATNAALNAYRKAYPSEVKGLINQVYLAKKTPNPNLMPRVNTQDANLSISQQYQAISYYNNKALVPKLFKYDPEEYRRSTKVAVGLLTLAVILLLAVSFLALALYGPFIHIAVATLGNWLWLSFSTVHLHTFLCACIGIAGGLLYLGIQELVMPGFLQHTKNAVVDLFSAVRKWHQHKTKKKLWQEQGLLDKVPSTDTITQSIRTILEKVEKLRQPTHSMGKRLAALNELLSTPIDKSLPPIERYFKIKKAVIRVCERQQIKARRQKPTGYRFSAIAKLFGLSPVPKLSAPIASEHLIQP